MDLSQDPFCQQLLDTVEQNQVTILRGDTGSGKSTKSMIALVQQNFSVVSAQPRIINTLSLQEYCSPHADIGFKNGNGALNASARGLFVTSGILTQMLLDPSFEPDFVAIDECHEFSQQQELCLALIKKRLASGWKTKVLIVSATLNDDEISSYFDNVSIGNVHMGGVKFPVERKQIQSESEVLKYIKKSFQDGRRILFFLPGKQEIQDWKKKLEFHNQDWKLKFRISEAHSEVDNIHNSIRDHGVAEIILSTDICAAGVTPENVSVVIDSGERKQVVEDSGIWSLKSVHCSQAELLQRLGRTGRQCEGEYVLFSNKEWEARSQYPTPEIKRQNIQKLELDVRSIGESCKTLQFVHQPDDNAVDNAISILSEWGLLSEGILTDLGREACKLPVEPSLARMLLEAKKLQCTQSVILATSIMAVGKLLRCNIKVATNVNNCDFAALMHVYKRMSSNQQDRRDYQDQIIGKNMNMVKDRVRRLQEVFGNIPDRHPERYQEALATTMTRYKCVGSNKFGAIFECPKTGVNISAGNESVVNVVYGDEVLGIPKKIAPRNGGREFLVLTSISKLPTKEVKDE